MFFRSPLLVAFAAIMLATYLLFMFRPALMFDAAGKPKQFGIEREETLLPVWLANCILGYFVYMGIRGEGV